MEPAPTDSLTSRGELEEGLVDEGGAGCQGGG